MAASDVAVEGAKADMDLVIPVVDHAWRVVENVALRIWQFAEQGFIVRDHE
jgi:hypothetical protein